MKIHPQFWAGIIFSVGLATLFNAVWFRFEGESGAGVIATVIAFLFSWLIIFGTD